MFYKLYGFQLCVRKYIYTHKQPVTGKFVCNVTHLQVMSSLHFKLGDAESFVNDL